MPTRARSASAATDTAVDQTDSAAPTTKVEVGAAVHQGATGQSRGFLAGFHVPLPGMGDVDPLRLLWLGGLAALATIEIIEWPVALTLGVGSYVAERLARQEVLQEVRPHGAARA
jgi:hydrogenase/urease accessory protein HupE